MGSKGKDRDYGDCEEIVDAVMDMIAKRWTKSMIKRELREWFPGLSASSAQWIITQAKRKICKIYNIDPKEYKGKQIAFYELILRGGDKTHDKLAAAERLDKLLGLEHITIEDPALMAAKIIEFKRQAEKTVGGQSDGHTKQEQQCGSSETCEDEGSRQDDAGNICSGSSDKGSSQEKEAGKDDNVIGEEDGTDVSPKDPVIKANIDDVLKKQSDPKVPQGG